jgi:hypothetical protein
MSTVPLAAQREAWEAGPGLLVSMWRHRWLLVAAVVIGSAAGLAVGSQRSPTYEATALVRLADPQTSGIFERQDRQDAEMYTSRQHELVRSSDVLERAAPALGGTVSAADVRSSLDISSNAELLTIEVKASAPEAEAATAIANGVAEAYQLYATERDRDTATRVLGELDGAARTLQSRIGRLETRREALLGTEESTYLQRRVEAWRLTTLVHQLIRLEARMLQVATEADLVGSTVESIEPATVPSAPSAPHPQHLAVFGAILAGALGSVLAYWRAGRVGDATSASIATELLEAPILGRLDLDDKGPGLRTRNATGPSVGSQAEYELLHAAIEGALGSPSTASVLMTRISRRRDGARECVRLAVAASRAGRHVLLIDGDHHSQDLTRLLGAADHPGLTEVIEHRVTLDEATIELDPRHGTVRALPAGRARYSASFRPSTVADVLFRISEWNGGLTLIHTAPPHLSTAATLLAEHVDGVLVLVDSATSRAELNRVRERLRVASASLLGFVFIGGRRG